MFSPYDVKTTAYSLVEGSNPLHESIETGESVELARGRLYCF